MRIALFGDLHGNMVAVEAFHQDVKARHVDALYCLGDLVGKGPRSLETMDWALAHCDIVLQGNWDDFVQLPYDREEAVRQAEAVPGLPFAEAFINEIRTGRYSR